MLDFQLKNWRGWAFFIAGGFYFGYRAEMPVAGLLAGMFFWLGLCGVDYLWNKLTRSKKK